MTAIRSIAGSTSGDGAARAQDEENKAEPSAAATSNFGADQVEVNENNWYASQIYMFLKREYALMNSQAPAHIAPTSPQHKSSPPVHNQ